MHINRADLERLVVELTSNQELSAIQAHVQECRACQIDMLDGGPVEPRRQSARVKVLNPLTSNGPSRPAELLDSPSNGLHVRVQQSILIGSFVHVRLAEGALFGEVRYCIPAGSAVFPRVSFEAASPQGTRCR